jgi:23S rRNA (guanine745-N1)-methyltransferase
VLRPGGWLAVAYPGPDHLVEIADGFRLMRQHEDKTRSYTETAERFIGPPTIDRLLSHAVLDDAAVRNAILMGPNARHITPPTMGLARTGFAGARDAPFVDPELRSEKAEK